ncbi:hypothetical protein BURPS406E_P0322 [Burkholderia pseudomallei 406e]|nr:hypothetical protein BURPS406E_P0322 [Burkholderia pseudomallei 406e]
MNPAATRHRCAHSKQIRPRLLAELDDSLRIVKFARYQLSEC